MTVSLPNESPEYRVARNALLSAEAELRTKVEEVASLRRGLPTGGRFHRTTAFDPFRRKQPLFQLCLDRMTLWPFTL